MKVRFTAIEDVQAIPPEALQFLRNALNRTPCNVNTLEEIFALDGITYIATSEQEILGAMFLVLHPFGNTHILNIVLLAGKKIHDWKHQLYDFIINIMHQVDATELGIIGRNGWNRLFPALRTVGAVYQMSIKPKVGGGTF